MTAKDRPLGGHFFLEVFRQLGLQAKFAIRPGYAT